LQYFFSRCRLGPERHALQVLQQTIGIDGVGFGAHHVSLREAPGSTRIDYHEFHVRVAVQRQGQLQMVNAGGF
jgi:hypothetical protein